MSITNAFTRLLKDTYDLTPSPVWDDAGQQTAVVYTADWLPTDLYVTREGTAEHGTTSYGPDDYEAFREAVAIDYEERTGNPTPDAIDL